MTPVTPRYRTVADAVVPDGWVRTTIPPIPDGKRDSSWRRIVTAVWHGQTGEDALHGDRISAGCEVAMPAGTLLLRVDKQATGTAYSRNGTYPTEDADCAVLLLAEDGTWESLWSRHFASASAATGAMVVKRMAKLLDAHPAPGSSPVMLVEVQVPNYRYEQECRACGRPVARHAGHILERGRTPVVEHWPACPGPDDPDPTPPPRCDNCLGPRPFFKRRDSNGVAGKVCDKCRYEPSYALSFG